MSRAEGTQNKHRHKQPDVQRIDVPRGELCIITDWCKGCGFCIEFCPRDVLATAEEFNRKGYHPPKVVQAEQCRNCDLCEMICPEFAIFSVALTDDAAAAEPAAPAPASAP